MVKKAFEEPDLELMLRGRPADLKPIQVQILAPQAPPAAPGLLRRSLRIVSRGRTTLLLCGAAGAAIGALFIAQQPRLFAAQASIEVSTPGLADVIARRAIARELARMPAEQLQLRRLPEYQPGYLTGLWRSMTGRPAELDDAEFQGALAERLRITPAAQGRLIDLEFQASDPPRASSFVDLLTAAILRDHASEQAEKIRAAREPFTVKLNRARTELQLAEDDHITAARSAMAAGASNSLKLELLRHEADSRRAQYESIAEQQRRAEAEAMRDGLVRTLAPARVSPVDQAWRAPAAVVLGAAAGLLLGIPICLVAAGGKHRVREARDITEQVGIAALGVVPHDRMRPGEGPLGLPDLDNPSGVRRSRSPGLAEAFRHVLASIWIAGQNDKRARVLLFTSANAREGKTTMAVNLAIGLANTNRRVLIIDGNLRKPQLSTMFGAPRNWGIADLLERETPVEDFAFEDLVFRTNIPGLYVLPAGSSSLAVAGMRHIDRLRDLLLRFRLEFHAVLIDTPAALDYPEARILGKLADAVVMVIRASSAPEGASTLARQFADDGATVLGAVLNDFRKNG